MTSKGVHKRVDGSDNYSTPLCAYEMLVPFVREVATRIGKTKGLTIYDPFYHDGSAKPYIEKAFAEFEPIVLHEPKWVDLDGVPTEEMLRADIIITNPPYTRGLKQKSTEFVLRAGKPVATLLPVDWLTTKGLRNVDGGARAQIIVPSGRFKFEVGGESKTKTAPNGSLWFCYGFELERDMYILS